MSIYSMFMIAIIVLYFTAREMHYNVCLDTLLNSLSLGVHFNSKIPNGKLFKTNFFIYA